MNGALRATAAPTPHGPTRDAASDPSAVPTAAGTVEDHTERLAKTTPLLPVWVSLCWSVLCNAAVL